ncbi:uncharacterized protein L201_003964 [Kwoniella dendrophila CBS 6074]|uniref:Uncharacterized protein n=1 Tax=Kwoniella dendrophila CBS 6074 TaxID=1295534 RepID=A0AAX4JV01_9TREE
MSTKTLEEMERNHFDDILHSIDNHIKNRDIPLTTQFELIQVNLIEWEQVAKREFSSNLSKFLQYYVENDQDISTKSEDNDEEHENVVDEICHQFDELFQQQADNDSETRISNIQSWLSQIPSSSSSSLNQQQQEEGSASEAAPKRGKGKLSRFSRNLKSLFSTSPEGQGSNSNRKKRFRQVELVPDPDELF